MRPTLAALMVCALLATATEASAKKDQPASAKAEKAEKAENKANKAAKPKKPGVSGAPKFIKGNEESTAERDRRLRRECKGRVNAGACAGYTG